MLVPSQEEFYKRPARSMATILFLFSSEVDVAAANGDAFGNDETDVEEGNEAFIFRRGGGG